MEQYLIGYIILMSSIGFWSMWVDKRRAVKRKYRISEKSLFTIALLGGSMGSILGMRLFRHKTKHWQFKVGMPIIFILQALIVCFILKTYPIF